MEWNDMSKGKWDVRNRLSADRHKLSLQSSILTVSDSILENNKANLRAALWPCYFNSNIFGYCTLQIVKHGLQVCAPQ